MDGDEKLYDSANRAHQIVLVSSISWVGTYTEMNSLKKKSNNVQSYTTSFASKRDVLYNCFFFSTIAKFCSCAVRFKSICIWSNNCWFDFHRKLFSSNTFTDNSNYSCLAMYSFSFTTISCNCCSRSFNFAVNRSLSSDFFFWWYNRFRNVFNSFWHCK